MLDLTMAEMGGLGIAADIQARGCLGEIPLVLFASRDVEATDRDRAVEIARRVDSGPVDLVRPLGRLLGLPDDPQSGRRATGG